MTRGYWIVKADVSDQEIFMEYAKRTQKILENYGGKFLARAGNYQAVEGSTRSRNTIIEFPSFELAINCWNSAEYQEVKLFRIGAAELDVVIVEGINEA